MSDPAQTLLSLHSRSLYWITSGVEEQTSDSSASIPQQQQPQHRSYLFSQSISHKCRKRRHHINRLLSLIRSYNKLALSYTAVWQHSGYEVDTKKRLGAGWGGKCTKIRRIAMIGRKSSPKSLFPSTPSPKLSPRCSSALSHWDADDEAAMSAEELVSSQPSSVAIPQEFAHGPYCPRRPTLTEVLSNTAPPPWTLSAFMAYLSQNYCLETLEFTMDATRYRKHYEKMAAQMAGMPMSSDYEDCEYVRMLWQRLLDAYIVPNGPREVNLPSNVRDDLLSLPNAVAPPPPESLDPAVKIVYELMDESVLVPFLNEVSSVKGPQSCASSWNDSDENIHTRGSLDERSSHRSRARRRPSPIASSTDLSYIPSNRDHPRAYTTSGRGSKMTTSVNHNLSGSGDASLTDDSVSGSSPGREPMTPPTTPPSSDMAGSPRLRHDNTWKKMTGRLGWKKKSGGGLRDSRFAAIEDEGYI